MPLTNFSINAFNNSMEKDISRQTLNFCKAIILSTKKLSITVKHDPCKLYQKDDQQYATLNPDLSTRLCADFENFYYGVSPVIDSFSIINAISQLSFRTTAALECFVSQHCSHFMLHKEQAVYLPDVAKLILLTAASKFGITLKLCDQLSFLVTSQASFPEMITIDNKKSTISLHGCPTDELISLMEPYRFACIDGIWELRESGTTFTEIYASKDNIKLLVGKVFYSGVLLKPIEIVPWKNDYENVISNYQIIYERSTFATVCAFDDNRTRHPLLATSAAALKKMFSEDDACKERLSQRLSDSEISEEGILEAVNEYIRKSLNVNQIGISSNVKTSDDQIFFGLRGSGNIDTGSLYPGINGNAEVYDPKVSFYHRSIYEDLPTVHLNEPRSDLLGEIEREAYGELRLITKRESWECYGLIISGNLPPAESASLHTRRCHFNVLFENEVDCSLETIIERKAKASESFENTNFAGIRIRLYKNRLHRLSSGAVSMCKGLLSRKESVESLLVLLLAFTSVRAVPLSLDNLSSVFSTIFAILILLTNIIHLIKHLVKRVRVGRITKTIYIYQSMSYDHLCRTVSKALRNQYHPAAYASLKMHIENAIYSRQVKD